MNEVQLQNLQTWFDNYVTGFYGDDDYLNANIRLKQEHSKRVTDEILYLADELALDANQRRVAQAAALLHDVGRFEQFKKYRTYNDPRSVNHCLLGLEILRSKGALDGLEEREKQIIEKAIEYHGARELPAELNGELLLHCKLLRDADKIDIYYVLISNYQAYRENSESFILEVDLPDEPGYSSEVVDDILAGRSTDYSRLRKLNDLKLLQLGWVFDVNYPQTLSRIRQRRFLEAICALLPATDDIEKVKAKVFGFVDKRKGAQTNGS